MTLKQQIKHLLEINLEARERSNRYRVVWYILYQRYHNETIDKKMFLEVGPEIESIWNVRFYPRQRNRRTL